MGGHGKCEEGHNATQNRPSRLIAIQKETVKLIHTQSLDVLPPYATLSYCWGSEEFLKMGPENMEFFTGNAPIPDLPRIFPEAIFVAPS